MELAEAFLSLPLLSCPLLRTLLPCVRGVPSACAWCRQQLGTGRSEAACVDGLLPSRPACRAGTQLRRAAAAAAAAVGGSGGCAGLGLAVLRQLSPSQHDAQMDYYGTRLATCSSDRSLKIFDVRNGGQILIADLRG